MEVIAYAASLTALGAYLSTEGKKYQLGGRHTEFGQPWRSGTRATLGVNRLVHPDSNRFFSSNGHMSKLPLALMNETYTAKKLRATPYTTSQRNNHLIHKNYVRLPVFTRYGNETNGASQYSQVGKHQIGNQHTARRVLPVNQKPKQFGAVRGKEFVSNDPGYAKVY